MTSAYPNEYDIRCDLDACQTYPIITDSERGEMFCGGCGSVLVQRMEDAAYGERGHSWEEFSSRSRTGPGTSLAMNDRGLSTMIGRNVDSSGNALSGRTRQTFNRLRVWDQRSRSRSVSNLGKALIQLNAMGIKLGVPEPAVEKAAYIYRKAVGEKLTRGRTVSSLIAASLYAACRESGIPRTLDDMARVSNVERRILSRDLRTMLRKLGMSLTQYDTSSFITKIANNLGLKEKTKRDAVDLLRRAEEIKITAGKNPVAQAAAALYIACMNNGEGISQKSFSREAGVSDVTVRNRATFLKKNLGL
ncbi:transcription initiation factor TFIIB [Cenarchaeum symbiosum A]|uniref:Transcription initiation factor IIB n=1 Tax=Cenarchaeum symbiosum (strain A) TaxID=414004 RepID=A0RYL8_CENSY|nr:transcription initiation factor TFIIB [Cenarchaeum symbiosum A]